MDTELSPDIIKFQHNYYHVEIEKSLNVVREYIVKNNLIIVGGMAIDMALRNIGKSIYSDHDIPDYDVYSDDPLLNCKELIKILCEMEMPNVGMMSAIHNTTIRVKMSGYTLFDCTYVPKTLMTNIPIVKHLEYTIIDPNYQKIDQYNSLSFLFDMVGPTYNIFHRLVKDDKRNKLLNENFKIEVQIENKKNISEMIEIKLPINIFDQDEKNKFISYDNLYFETDYNFCLHGIAAYSMYYNYVKQMKKSKEAEELFQTCNIANIEIKNNELLISVPFGLPVVLINNNTKYINMESELKLKHKYNQLLNLLPPRTTNEDESIQIYDLYGRLLSVQQMKLDGRNMIVSNYTYQLSYFLTNYYFSKSHNNIYLSYYNSLLALKEIDLLSNNTQSDIFTYSISTFGNDNYFEAYFYYMKNLKSNYDTKNNLTDKPKSSYLTHPKCESTVEFDYNSSEFFLIDGEQNDNMISTNFSRYNHLFDE